MPLLKWLTVLLFITILVPFCGRPVTAQDEVTWLLDQINGLRTSRGQPPYALNGILSTAAQAHSQWMADTGMVSHEETNGSTPKSRADALEYGGSLVSENIYGGSVAKATDAWNFWVNSPIHYHGLTYELLNEVGIGIASGPYGNFYTLVFGNGGSGGNLVPPPTMQEESPPVLESPEAAVEQQAAAPTQNPPTEVWITWTPSPTVPTDTPTVTWTPTFTWTPSPTSSAAPMTSTPVPLSVLVASIPSLTPSVTPTEFVVALAPMKPDIPPAVEKKIVAPPESALNWRIVLPVLIIVQVILIGLTVQWMFNRRE
ncbi:MAG: CAP domain-containing protein [Anaerolineae bacterium]|nr:CAP domain-containing protein [Anaerolineae bacterium]